MQSLTDPNNFVSLRKGSLTSRGFQRRVTAPFGKEHGVCRKSHIACQYRTTRRREEWTEKIHEEWIWNVLEDRPDLTTAQLMRTRELMDRHGGACLVTSYEALIPTLTLPDADDRHALAAAIKGQASVIVTLQRHQTEI